MLHIRPGTDGTLAMFHAIIRENLYDHSFAEDYAECFC